MSPSFSAGRKGRLREPAAVVDTPSATEASSGSADVRFHQRRSNGKASPSSRPVLAPPALPPVADDTPLIATAACTTIAMHTTAQRRYLACLDTGATAHISHVAGGIA